MNAQTRSPQGVSDHVHPRIYMAAAGLLVWFVIAAWLLFGGSDYIGLALAMISVLVFMTIAIPLALWRTHLTAQRSSRTTEQGSETLDKWLRGQFATWTDQEKGSTAAIASELWTVISASALARMGDSI